MNAQPAPVVAVDLPSGINGTSGAMMGSAVNATQTVTFFRKKPGHLLLPGTAILRRRYPSPILAFPKSVLDQIGAEDLRKHSANSGTGSFPHPIEAGHKYDRGHVVVASGPVMVDGGGPSCGARGVTRGRGVGDDRKPARSPGSQCGG